MHTGVSMRPNFVSCRVVNTPTCHFVEKIMTTETLLRELEELEKKATPGPWYATFDEAIKVNSKSDGLLAICTNLKNGYSRRPTDEVEINAKLIASLRNAFPEIAAAMRVAILADELCDAVDLVAEDIGGCRRPSEILAELGPAVDAMNAARAKEEPRDG